MSKTLKDLIIITFSTLILTFLVWLPHILAIPNLWGLNFSAGFSTIYRNFDGLEYVIIARSWYDPNLIAQIPQQLPTNYYASHFPGYSILIAFFAPIFGFLKSMLFVSLLFTIFSAIAFYYLVKDFKLSSHPLFLSLIFLILPARWLVVHSVGSSETVFIFFVILSIYFLMKFELYKKYSFLIFSGLFVAFAQITRPPGALLFLALALYAHNRSMYELRLKGLRITASDIKHAISNHFTFIPLLIAPATLLLIFFWYAIVLGDFWAYFHSGDNIHLSFPPFQVFNKSQFWVGDIWLEDIVYLFIIGFLAGLILIKKRLYPMAFFVLTYLAAAIFVAHRDISRYILPIFPFVLIAFEKVLVSREFKIVLGIIALAVYLYAQNFILLNTAPVSDLTPFN